MKKLFHLTQNGQEDLKSELKALIAERGPVAERIKTARELGDLSENAEYQTARQEQDRLEARISELEHIIHNSQIITKPKSGGSVRLGSRVKLKKAGLSKEFQVVGTMEADPISGKVSDESPIGKALLGKKVGDSVAIKTPADSAAYKIAEID